jgi:DUF4097 and DUF4098 domain-containing protein YvlB
MKNGIRSILIVLLMAALSNIFSMQNTGKISKTFPAKKLVEIHTASGDVIIKKGPSSQISVDVAINVKPEDAFRPEFNELGDRLKLSEDWTGRASGKVTWTVTVPAQTEIELKTASGDVSVDGLTKELEIKTASGDVTIENSSGDIEVQTASGDVDLKEISGDIEVTVASGDVSASGVKGNIEVSSASGDVKMEQSEGEFDLSTASGDIEMTKITLQASSEMSAASGDIDVVMAKSPANDLTLKTASGNLELNYNGNPLKGKFVFTANSRGGSIVAPFEFEKEETFKRHGREAVRKTVSFSGDTPVISLETASGGITFNK